MFMAAEVRMCHMCPQPPRSRDISHNIHLLTGSWSLSPGLIECYKCRGVRNTAIIWFSMILHRLPQYRNHANSWLAHFNVAYLWWQLRGIQNSDCKVNIRGWPRRCLLSSGLRYCYLLKEPIIINHNLHVDIHTPFPDLHLNMQVYDV